MASIEPNDPDNPTVWRVKWRDNAITLPDGRKKAFTITFSSEAQAIKLKQLVDEPPKNCMPEAKLLDAYGLLWVLGSEQGQQAKAQETAAAAQVIVSQLCWKYLEHKEKSPRPPSARTLKEYKQYVRDHVDTHWFGALPADDADQDQARDWQREIAAKPGYSAESAMKVRTSVVAPAFKWARITTKKGQVPIRTWSSPFEGLPMLETVVDRRDLLENVDQIHTLINCAYQIDPNWADLVVAKLCSGSRYGEISVPLIKGIRPRGIEVLQRQSGGEIKQGTKAGTNIWRYSPLPPQVMEIISLRVSELSASSLIFSGPLGNRWAYQPYWRRWDTLREKLAMFGIDKYLTGHCMRHTCNSMLISSGVHANVVQMMTGHARPGEKKSMTGHYTNWTDPMMDQVLEVTTRWVDIPIVKARIEALKDGEIYPEAVALKPLPKKKRASA